MEANSAIDGDPALLPATPEYQSLSGAAVLAFVLGLASPLALADPALLAVPAAAVCMAILAQRKIRDSAGTQTGVTVARFGLALALISATAALAHGPVRDALYRRQSAEVAQRWFTLLAEDRIDDAMALLGGQAAAGLQPPARSPGDKPLPREEALTVAREKLRSDPVVRCLNGKKTPLTVAMTPDAAPPLIDSGRATLAAEFTITGASDQPPCRVSLQFVRYSAYSVSGQPWRIERWAESATKP